MALRFSSLHYLAMQAWQSLLRFPLTILSSMVAVVMAISLIETQDEQFNRFPYINAMLTAALGISLYFCVAVFASRQQLRPGLKLLAQLIATAFLLLVYFSFPNADATHNTSLPYIRYALYSIIIHLLVSFIPFLFSRQLNGFWNYNKALFLRFLTALLYSAFLYVGLVMALLALKTLFEVEIPSELFFQLFILIAGLFNTWFFVAGVPLAFDALESDHQYPRGLKVFSQYILLPLLALYLLILYGYGFKIILSWDWPEGIVSYLIMLVSVLGILAMLLIYPYARQAENQWISKVSRGYYFLLLPLLVLLFFAIGMRLADYGFTINRYLILVVGLWLAVVCIYFVSGRNNIKFVPLSLATLLLSISFGPWSIFSVSERSQAKRLEAILTQASIMRDGKVLNELRWPADMFPYFPAAAVNRHQGLLSDSLHNEVYSILNYLDNHHGMQTIRDWYEQPLDSLIRAAEASFAEGKGKKASEAEVYMKSLGLAYRYKTDYAHSNYYTYSSRSDIALDVRHFRELIFLGQLYSEGKGERIAVAVGGVSYQVDYPPAKSALLRISIGPDTLHFPLGQRIRELGLQYGHSSNYDIPLSAMSLDTLHQQVPYRLVIDELSFQQKGETVSLQQMSGKLLIGEREK